MRKTTLSFLTCSLLICSSCHTQDTGLKEKKALPVPLTKAEEAAQDIIIEEHHENGAAKHHYYSAEWQRELDKGLEKDSTIAYLWQQKAMPLFKQGKYEAGMKFIDKAVYYDPLEYQPYRAFIKCIFAKTYQDAIIDFQDCRARDGNLIVMDHSYDFHIGLSYLQLNEFEQAEKIFEADYDSLILAKGEDWLHHLDLFYYGISRYEQGNYEGAIEMFDKALHLYPEFSDVQAYKAQALQRLGKNEEAILLWKEAEANGKKEFTINEDNVVYERYPYQVRW